MLKDNRLPTIFYLPFLIFVNEGKCKKILLVIVYRKKDNFKKKHLWCNFNVKYKIVIQSITNKKYFVVDVQES